LSEISKLLNVDFNTLADDNLTIDSIKSNNVVNSDEVRPRKWLLVLLIIIAIIIVIILANKYVNDKKLKEDDNFDIFGGFNELFDFENIDKTSFNRQFEIRSGTKWGSSVSNLLDDIITNNKTNDKHIITVVFDDLDSSDPNKIKESKKKLEDFKDYEVSLDYDENGFVYKITIEACDNDTNTNTNTNNNIDKENNIDNNNSIDNNTNNNINSNNSSNNDTSNSSSDFDKNFFNSSFELYSGTKSGFFVSSLLDHVITNNKTEVSHIIKIIYNDINTVDENEIRNIKSSLDTWTDYEVILDYDGNGYVSVITIK